MPPRANIRCQWYDIIAVVLRFLALLQFVAIERAPVWAQIPGVSATTVGLGRLPALLLASLLAFLHFVALERAPVWG